VCATDANRKPIEAIVSLRPPSIEDGKVEAAVQYNLLPAGAGSFERSSRSVQPDVNALHKMLPHIDVIVFEKDESFRKRTVMHKLGDLLKYRLAWYIVRMSFPREDELDRPLRVVDHHGDLFKLLQNQIGALVCREAARKTNSQCIRAQHA